MPNYRTSQGDTWDIISYRLYKTEKKVAELIEANPQYREVVIFAANVVLNAPVITVVNTAPAPPWRQNG